MHANIISLAVKSLRFRKFSAGLTVFSLALSVMLLLSVDTIRLQAKNNFINTIAGTDLIVGSRSGSVQLLLYTIFHIGKATNNVSWQSYKKISRHPRVAWSIPIALGDSHQGFRVVGTTQDYFKYYRYQKNKPLGFDQGQALVNLFDAVIGAGVAKKLGYAVGDDIILAHGIGKVSLNEHKNLPFKISGILAPTGSPVDDSVLISLKALAAIHIGWESGVAIESNVSAKDLSPDDPRLAIKSITAFLLGLQSKHDIFSMQRAINDYKHEPLLAVLPTITLLELWQVVSVIEKTLMLIAGLVILIGLFSMLAIMLTNLNARRREIAVLRSVGASPRSILLLIILETELLVALGISLGLIMLYAGLLFANPLLAANIGIQIELSAPTLFQSAILAGILLAGLIISLIPAYHAYKNTLQDGLTVRS